MLLIFSTFSKANEHLLQEKYSSHLLTGDSQSFLIQENDKSIFEVEGFGLDVTIKISAPNKEWKLASWRGISGRIRFALTKDEAKYTKLVISTTDKLGPEGEFRIEKIINSTNDLWQAERAMMNGLDIHYRHYLKEDIDRKEALPNMQTALSYWLSQKSQKEIARISFELAAVHKGLSNINIAYKNYLIAKTNWLELNDLNAAATAANVMGLIDRSKGEYNSALQHFKDAQVWRESLGLKQPAAISSNNMALVYLDRGNFTKAIKMFKQAIIGYGWGKQIISNLEKGDNDLFITDVITIGDIKRATLMFNNLALAYDKNGNHLKAISLWKKSLVLSRHISDQTSIGIIQNNIGRAYYDRGLMNKAEDYLTSAYQVLNASSDKKHLALVNFNLAELLTLIGKNNDALDYYETSKILRKAYNDLNGYYDSLLAIGKVHKSLQNFNLATEYLYQAELGFRQLELKGKQGLVLYELAGLFYRNNNFTTAVKLVNKSLKLLNSNGTKRDQARSYLLLGNIDLGLTNYKKALENFKMALTIAENNNDQLLVPSIMAQISVNHDKLNNLDLAIQAAKVSINKFNKLIQQFELSSDIAHFSESYYSVVVHLSQLMLKIGNIENALLIYDQARSRTLGLWNYQFNNNDLIEAELNKINSLEEQLQSENLEKSQIEETKKKIRLAYQELQKRTINNSRPKQRLTDIPQINEGTILIQYMLSDPNSTAFILTNDSVKSFRLPKMSVIEKNVRDIHQSLENQNRQKWLEGSNNLENILFPRRLNLSHFNKLIIIADGPLQTLPFAALKNHNKYIIEHVELSYFPSLNAYNLANNNINDIQFEISIYADPIYQKNDERYINNKIQSITTDFGKVAGLIRGGNNLNRLLGAKNESQEIQSLTKKHAILKTGFSASRENFISNKNDSSILHIAAHSIPNEKMSGLSSIELSRYDRNGNKLNSSLRAIDISGLKGVLNPKLVVLSACETSLGEYIRGEGYLGLTRAFLEIGTQNVVSTLWKIDDHTTADLMKVFYQELIKGKTVTSSLRLAQNTIRKDKPNPFYWAGFVSHGNSNLSFKPIVNKR